MIYSFVFIFDTVKTGIKYPPISIDTSHNTSRYLRNHKLSLATHGGGCIPRDSRPAHNGLAYALLIAIRYYSISLSILYGTSFLRAFPSGMPGAIHGGTEPTYAILYLDFHSSNSSSLDWLHQCYCCTIALYFQLLCQ